MSTENQDTLVLDLPAAQAPATPPAPVRTGVRGGVVALIAAAALILGVALGAAWSPRAHEAEAANARLATALQEADASAQLQAASAAQQNGDAAEAAQLLADLADRLEGAAAAGPQDDVTRSLNDAASLLRALSRATGELDTSDGGSWTDLVGPLLDGLLGSGDGQGSDGLGALLGGQA